MKIPLSVFKSEIKIELTLKKIYFLFLLCFKIAKKIVYSNASSIRTETQLSFYLFCVKSDASSMLTGNDIGGKHSLKLKNSLRTGD